MKVSLVPSWFHKSSAFATAAVSSMALWPWGAIVSENTAIHVIATLGFMKLTIEFLTRDVPKDTSG